MHNSDNMNNRQKMQHAITVYGKKIKHNMKHNIKQ